LKHNWPATADDRHLFWRRRIIAGELSLGVYV